MQSALNNNERSLRIIRRWLLFFMVSLALSGLSAVPVVSGAQWLSRSFPPGTVIGNWMDEITIGITFADKHYPFLFYGYDWLAFAHILFAILFIGAWRDPVRNRWVLEFGMIACILIIPVALVAGYFRGIPIWWRFLDCSFGIIGIIPLSICNTHSWKMEHSKHAVASSTMFATDEY